MSESTSLPIFNPYVELEFESNSPDALSGGSSPTLLPGNKIAF